MKSSLSIRSKSKSSNKLVILNDKVDIQKMFPGTQEDI